MQQIDRSVAGSDVTKASVRSVNRISFILRFDFILFS